MIKKRGENYRKASLEILGIIMIIALVLLLISLPAEYKYSKDIKYSDDIFKQKFVKDDFNVIDGSEIKFLNLGIEVEDFLLVNSREYRMDRENIEDILIRKQSTNQGKKIIYGLRNEGGEKEIQFIWKSHIPENYDQANSFNLSRNFITNSQFVKLYTDGAYKSYLTFEDVGTTFGGVSLSYDAETRILTASSDKIKLDEDEEIVMDPGAGMDEDDPLIGFSLPTPYDGKITNDPIVETNATIWEENLERFIWDWNGTDSTFYINNLVLMLDFDNIAAWGEDGTHAKDFSYYGNDGEIHGAGYAEGFYGKALSFDGVDDYVDVEDEGSLDLDILSIEFMFKPDEEYDGSSGYVSFIEEDNYRIYMENGKMVFEYDESKVDSATDVWMNDEWYHVIATYDGEMKIFVNGIKENSAVVIGPFTLKDMDGNNVAFFLSTGDIVLKGGCSAAETCAVPDIGGFIIEDEEGEAGAYIDYDGNLCIEDSECEGNHENCDNPSDGSFIIKDTDGRIVSYINSSGGLCLVGKLRENEIE
ncbi:LamG domain-containing protein [Candidatus Woesearchaeota archaeon]|nr:LamG domain-containing protein [Candidatus Woesearchaeota archaeon]